MENDETPPSYATARNKTTTETDERAFAGRKQRWQGRPLLAATVFLMAALNATALPASADLIPAQEPTPAYSVGSDVAGLDAVAAACIRSGDDNGMGGTHVTCKYSCSANAELLIGVHASDGDAYAYGDTSCGGTTADCENPNSGSNCAGASKGLSTSRQSKASCKGHSDEFWDSPITVSCSSIGADPDTICEVVPDAPVCEGADPGAILNATDVPTPDPEPWVPQGPPEIPPVDPCGVKTCPNVPREVCLDAAPVLRYLPEETLEQMFPQDSGSAETLVAAFSGGDRDDATGGIWALFEDGVCITGAMA